MRWNFDTKNEVRDIALRRKTPAKAAILLPGENQLCLRQGVKSGLFDPRKTKLICIDDSPSFAAKIKRVAHRLGFTNDTCFVFAGKADRLTRQMMMNFFDGRKVDFAFLDFCGQLTRELARWIGHECRDIFEKDSCVSYTFSLPVWNPSLYITSIDTKSLINRIPNKAGIPDEARETVAGLFLAMGVNYTVAFSQFIGYQSSYPMLWTETLVKKVTPTMPPTSFLAAI
jgi:hypothetical protein